MSLFGFWFDDPLFFLGLLAIPLLIWRAFWARRMRAAVPTPTSDGLRRVATPRSRSWWLPDVLRIVAVTALVVALARPQLENKQLVTGEGVDIMLALDMSTSMNAVDMTQAELEDVLVSGDRPNNRFEAAREILRSFVLSRSQDRIGLVVFGEQAWLKYPLTLDYSRLAETLDGLILDNGVPDPRTNACFNGCAISGAGTAIGDALARAYNRLRRSKAKTRLIILITDGKQTAGTIDPLAISRHLRDRPEGEKPLIFTFLVGSNEQTWLPELDRRGRQVVDARDVPVYSPPGQPFPVDPGLLRSIAEMTGGKFYESYNEEKFKEDIADLERTVFKSEVHVTRSDSFMPLVILVLLLLAGEWLLRFTVYRSVL